MAPDRATHASGLSRISRGRNSSLVGSPSRPRAGRESLSSQRLSCRLDPFAVVAENEARLSLRFNSTFAEWAPLESLGLRHRRVQDILQSLHESGDGGIARISSVS